MSISAAIDRESIRRYGFIEFVRRAWPRVETVELIEEPHIQLMARHLEGAALRATGSFAPVPQPWMEGLQEIPDLCISVPPGSAQPHSEPVLLARGWTPMGEVVPGDLIYGSDGKLHNVLAVFPQGIRDVWEVTFSDGEVVRCDKNHLWTFVPAQCQDSYPVTKTAGEWAETVLRKRAGQHMKSMWFCPMLSNPIDYPTQELPLDPYLLGLLLGDGGLTTRAVRFTSADDELIDAFKTLDNLVVKECPSRSNAREVRLDAVDSFRGSKPVGCLVDGCRRKYATGGCCQFHFKKHPELRRTLTPEQKNRRINPLRRVLEELGVMGLGSHDKFVPLQYRRSSVGQRLALLQGLMDTDGHVDGSTAVFSSVSPHLIQAVHEIVTSLGGTCTVKEYTAKIYEKEYGRYQTARCRLPFGLIPFRLRRKVSRFESAAHQRKPTRAVISVKKTESRELASCIRVSAKDSLYVTKGHVLTHNSKTSLTSVLFPAWLWTFAPQCKIICTSYSEVLALRDAKRSFELMSSDWYKERWPNVVIPGGDRVSMAYYTTSEKGMRFSVQMGGSVTGMHAHLLIADDPAKPQDLLTNASDALARVVERWDQTFSSRSAHPATFTRIVIAQRLHEGDLTGVMEKRGAVNLRLPMLYEAELPYSSPWGSDLRTEEGQLLCPKRFPQEVIDTRRGFLASRDWAAQYQQRPVPADGAVFQRPWMDHRYKGRPWPANQQMTLSVDCSLKEGKSSDYTVLQVWCRVGANFYLIDQVRERIGFVGQLAAIRNMKSKWPHITRILIELKANGDAVLQSFKGNLSGVIGVHPEGSKRSRAEATTYLWESGCVLLPEFAPWLENFVHEHLIFDAGVNDDCVDAASQYLNYEGKKTKHAKFKEAMNKQRPLLDRKRWTRIV